MIRTVQGRALANLSISELPSSVYLFHPLKRVQRLHPFPHLRPFRSVHLISLAHGCSL
ncbi:MAG: hypothetical protein ACK41W_12460 [Cyanobacteriota bacterium]